MGVFGNPRRRLDYTIIPYAFEQAARTPRIDPEYRTGIRAQGNELAYHEDKRLTRDRLPSVERSSFSREGTGRAGERQEIDRCEKKRNCELNGADNRARTRTRFSRGCRLYNWPCFFSPVKREISMRRGEAARRKSPRAPHAPTRACVRAQVGRACRSESSRLMNDIARSRNVEERQTSV